MEVAHAVQRLIVMSHKKTVFSKALKDSYLRLPKSLARAYAFKSHWLLRLMLWQILESWLDRLQRPKEYVMPFLRLFRVNLKQDGHSHKL